MPALVRDFSGVSPRIAEGVFLAETSVVIGDVELGPEANIWYGSVLRGDVGAIRLGARCNIQDLVMVHMTRGQSSAVLGDDVTVGHSAIIHGARVGAGALIGMGAILLDNAVIGEECIVGAGSLVTSDFVAPPRTLLLGRPARVARELSAEECQQGRRLAARYVELGRAHAR